jgi:hypothetical protein
MWLPAYSGLYQGKLISVPGGGSPALQHALRVSISAGSAALRVRPGPVL